MLRGCGWFLTGYLEDGVILDIRHHGGNQDASRSQYLSQMKLELQDKFLGVSQDDLTCQAEIWHTRQESHIMMIHYVKNDLIIQVSSQEPSTSSKYGLRGWEVFDILLIML